MQTVWFKGVKDVEKRKQELASYRSAFDALKEILEEHYRKNSAVRDYSPGWEYKQIAVNEYNQAIDDLIKLLNTKEN